MMPKVKIYEDEWYPVYDLWKSNEGVELPQELIDRYEAVLKEFNEVQDLIQSAYAAARTGGA
jgi:hypothetical protein